MIENKQKNYELQYNNLIQIRCKFRLLSYGKLNVKLETLTLNLSLTLSTNF